MNQSRVKICSKCKKEFMHGEIVYVDDFDGNTFCSMCKHHEIFVHHWEGRVTVLR